MALTHGRAHWRACAAGWRWQWAASDAEDIWRPWMPTHRRCRSVDRSAARGCRVGRRIGEAEKRRRNRVWSAEWAEDGAACLQRQARVVTLEAEPLVQLPNRTHREPRCSTPHLGYHISNPVPGRHPHRDSAPGPCVEGVLVNAPTFSDTSASRWTCMRRTGERGAIRIDCLGGCTAPSRRCLCGCANTCGRFRH